MLVFLSLLSYIFVPFSLTEGVSLSPSDHEKVIKTIETNQYVISLTGSGRNSAILTAFDDAESLFPEATFIITTSKSMKLLLNTTKLPEKPYISFFENGTLINSIGPIESGSSMLYIIDLMLYKQRPTLKNVHELVAALGEAPLTLVSQHKTFDHIFSVSKESMPDVGPINIITLSDSAAREISLNDNSCALFRSIDQELIPISCTKEDIIENSIPTFNYAKPANLLKSNKTAFIFHSQGQLMEYSGMMHQLGSSIPTMNFFLDIDRSVCKFLNDFVPDFCDHTNIALIDFKERYIYNISEIIDPNKIGYVFSQKWAQQIPKVLLAYEKRKLKKIPMSEKVPRASKLPVKKLVGKTYESFVNDTTKDTLVLFINPESQESSAAFPKFKRIADDIGRLPDEKKNETFEGNFTFGFVISTYNQIEGGFPHYPEEPALILYPANDKKHPRLLLGTNVSDIQLQLKLFASHKPTFETEEKVGDMQHFKEISTKAKTAMPKMNRQEKDTLLDTIKKVEAAFVKEQGEKEL